MPPNTQVSSVENVQLTTSEPKERHEQHDSASKEQIPMTLVWRNILLMSYLHLAAVYGLYLCFTSAKWQTSVAAFILYIWSGLGITAGAHRLWSHKSYKAKWPLRVLLLMMNTLAFQNDIYEWARDHRVHHKYSETHADPHNATRGFFFSHIGWLLVKKHPDVITKGKTVEMNDLLADPLVRFQRRNYLPLVVVFCFILPTIGPHLLWGETKWNSFFICALFRYCFALNMTWLVNSAAHMWGNRPYDHHINPSENLAVVFGAVGEGFHNYHHTFPWDYAASEYGMKINLTTIFIDFMALLGLAYDRKVVSRSVIKQRKERTGDGSH
ncbi:Acyl-CoA desaturase [Halotydeus destructor]|nr:Acyl-CoA desaturase [Halotydeus destructor]